jgi:hypothetical protein
MLNQLHGFFLLDWARMLIHNGFDFWSIQVFFSVSPNTGDHWYRRVVISTSHQWGAELTKLNVPADWKGLFRQIPFGPHVPVPDTVSLTNRLFLYT